MTWDDFGKKTEETARWWCKKAGEGEQSKQIKTNISWNKISWTKLFNYCT